MKKIVFATNNEHKLSEIRAILKGDFEIISLAEIGCTADIPETAGTLEGNALCKVRYVVENYRTDCFADDTGLEVDALGGAPGIFTARFGAMNNYGADHDAEANTRCLLAKLQGQTNRKARFRTAIALSLGGEEHLFEGIVEGQIATAKRGERGFGYDPVFIPDGYNLTFAELGADIKNRISHRARAVAELIDFLKKR
ncbi:MAG: non-canonical purine NTP diphosphatase [Prevotella sp.]|nr:non-canonical purine NTP diphosphatase [Prevotella sp.]